MTVQNAQGLHIGEEVTILGGLIGVVTSTPRKEQAWNGSQLVDTIVMDVHTVTGDEQVDNNVLEDC